MMDLKFAKPQGKPLGLARPQSIVDFDTFDGKSMASTCLETKPMTMNDSKLLIVTNQKGLTGWPLPHGVTIDFIYLYGLKQNSRNNDVGEGIVNWL